MKRKNLLSIVTALILFANCSLSASAMCVPTVVLDEQNVNTIYYDNNGVKQEVYTILMGDEVVYHKHNPNLVEDGGCYELHTHQGDIENGGPCYEPVYHTCSGDCENGGGCYTMENLHQHTGDSENGGGCYTIENKHIHEGDSVNGGGCYISENLHQHIGDSVNGGVCYSEHIHSDNCYIRCKDRPRSIRGYYWINYDSWYWVYYCGYCGHELDEERYHPVNVERLVCAYSTLNCNQKYSLNCGYSEGQVVSYSLGCGMENEQVLSYSLGCGFEDGQVESYSKSCKYCNKEDGTYLEGYTLSCEKSEEKELNCQIIK